MFAPRIWLALAIAAAVAAVIAGILAFAYHLGGLSVQHDWDKEKIAQEAARAELEMKSRQREIALVNLMDLQRKEKAREVKSILDQHNALVLSLLSRPDRPAGDAATTAPACSGQTGEALARPDAEFLAGYAADAARLNASLNQCEAAYNAARDTLNQGSKP